MQACFASVFGYFGALSRRDCVAALCGIRILFFTRLSKLRQPARASGDFG